MTLENPDDQQFILHMKRFNPIEDHVGKSPLETAAVAIDTYSEASGFQMGLIDNQARPSGALIHTPTADSPDNLTTEQFDRLKAELETTYGGQENAGKPLLLDGGLDWKPMGMNLQELDFIESKRELAREIALTLGVPPMVLGLPGDNTYANFREANLAFYRQTVLPYAQRMAPVSYTHLTLPTIYSV